MTEVPALVLYGRPACHLCDEMADEIGALLPSGSYRLRIENVDTDPRWRAAYGLRVPVLVRDDGEEICAVRLDPEALRAAVRPR